MNTGKPHTMKQAIKRRINEKGKDGYKTVSGENEINSVRKGMGSNSTRNDRYCMKTYKG